MRLPTPSATTTWGRRLARERAGGGTGLPGQAKAPTARRAVHCEAGATGAEERGMDRGAAGAARGTLAVGRRALWSRLGGLGVAAGSWLAAAGRAGAEAEWCDDGSPPPNDFRLQPTGTGSAGSEPAWLKSTDDGGPL